MTPPVTCVDAATVAIIRKSLDGVIRSWDAGAMQLFGYTADEIIGRSILVLIPLELRAQELDILPRLRRGERIDQTTTRVRKDGTRVDVWISVSPVRDASGRVIGAAKFACEVGGPN